MVPIAILVEIILHIVYIQIKYKDQNNLLF